jgi:inhibitor of KinA sporulation pathway (predicted exonuclease)
MEARSSWDNKGAVDLETALSEFQLWLQEVTRGDLSRAAVWGNGVDFDQVLLKNAYAAVGADAPWKYFNQYCFRTLKNMFPPKMPVQRQGTHHSALDDAVHQTRVVQQILRDYQLALP